MAFLSGIKNTVLLSLLILSACGNQGKRVDKAAETSLVKEQPQEQNPIVVGANQTLEYLPLLKGKRIAVVANQTSVIFKNEVQSTKNEVAKSESGQENFTHLVDSLLSHGITIEKVFAPEHGFRGKADAGEHVTDGIDTKTKLPIISLYGKNRKPSSEQLDGLDIVVFDIQDVGVRFYTYIATLQLVMEACAEKQIQILVLDRPNPNAHYIDGPSMEAEHMGFLGMTPIPLVYGMTIGEYAQMINQEAWLEAGLHADLTVVPLKNYSHDLTYNLAIRPSPNLPNDIAITLYASLGLFEGTNVNAGRGTEFQFQRYGAPFLDSTQYQFKYTPQPNFGAKNPKHKGNICFGKDLSGNTRMKELTLKWIINAYQNTSDKSLFFNTSGFTRHAGTKKLQQQIEAGLSEEEIKSTWQQDLENFKSIRKKYLLYK